MLHSRTLGELGAEQGPPVSSSAAVVKAIAQILVSVSVAYKYRTGTPSKKVISTPGGGEASHSQRLTWEYKRPSPLRQGNTIHTLELPVGSG